MAGGLVVVASAALPREFVPFGLFAALPFLGIGAAAAWKQAGAPTPARIAATLEAVRPMAWSEFADALETAYRADGYVVSRLADRAADFELRKAGRTTLLAARRWKVARTGIEPLRELVAARQARDARECLYVAIGEVTDKARRFATENRIGIVAGPELARLLPAAGPGAKRRPG